jgi:hypothetical protein
MSDLPTWEHLRDLISSYPKPPLRCRAVEYQGETPIRSASVVHDGYEGWYIDDGTRVELNTGRSAVFIERGKIRQVAGGAHANGWVKPLIQGKLIAYLYQGAGDVVGREVFESRPCLVADIEGLRRDEDSRFRFWVDEATGIILQEARLDQPGLVIRLQEPEIGELASGSRPVPKRPPFLNRGTPGTYAKLVDEDD